MLKVCLAVMATALVAGCCNKPGVQYAAVVPVDTAPAYPAPAPIPPSWNSLATPLEK